MVRENPSPTLARSTRSRASCDSGPTWTACSAILGERRHDAQGVVIGTGASSGGHQPNPLVLQAPHDELEHPSRGEVHPLDVIDGHHDGRGGGHRSEASKHGQGNGSLVGPGTRARGPQEGHLEGPALWLRQRRKRLLEDGLEEVTERGVGQPRLGLDRTAGQGAVARRRAPASPSFHTVVFPMPGSPDRSKALGAVGIESRKRWRIGELGLASDDFTQPAPLASMDGRILGMVDTKPARTRRIPHRRRTGYRPRPRSVAGGVGFEPTYGLPRKRFSRPPPSSARPPSRFPIYPGAPSTRTPASPG